MEESFEQVINEHLELKKRHDELGQAPTAGDDLPTPEAEEDVADESPEAENGDFWAAAREFDWGD